MDSRATARLALRRRGWAVLQQRCNVALLRDPDTCPLLTSAFAEPGQEWPRWRGARPDVGPGKRGL